MHPSNVTFQQHVILYFALKLNTCLYELCMTVLNLLNVLKTVLHSGLFGDLKHP